MRQAEDLFARHLDLAPLRGRRRGLVRCLFHQDQTPSFSVDLDAGVFHCFGCGAQGGVKRFCELVGEERVAPSPSRRTTSPLAEARARVLAEARRQRERLEACRPLNVIGDFLRTKFQAIAAARRVATAKGDTEQTWDLLAKAARVEAEARAVEAELDDLFPLDLDAPLAGGRT